MASADDSWDQGRRNILHALPNRRTDALGHHCGIRLNDMGGNTMSDQGGSPSGLTSNEAKEFHSAYVQGFSVSLPSRW